MPGSEAHLDTRLDERLVQRYGAGASRSSAPRPGQDAARVLDQLLGHRSVRAFTDQPVAPGTLEWLIAAAQSASSSSNLQAWSVVAVVDPARKARLARLAGDQSHIREAPLFLVWLADLSRHDRAAGRLGTSIDAHRYLETFLVGAIDASLAAQNAVVAAESLGLGTVYIGAIRNQPEAVSAELALPQRVFPVFGMCVGHPDVTRPASVKPRLAQRAVLHHETFSADGDGEAVAAYDAAVQDFQRSQGMPVQPWSVQATRRVSGAGSLSGRHTLSTSIRDQGFAIE